MADMFKLQVVTPDKFFYTGEVSMVELTTTEGEIGVYAQHIPMTSIVAPGVLSIHEGSEVKKAALHSGFGGVFPRRCHDSCRSGRVAGRDRFIPRGRSDDPCRTQT